MGLNTQNLVMMYVSFLRMKLHTLEKNLLNIALTYDILGGALTMSPCVCCVFVRERDRPGGMGSTPIFHKGIY